MKSEMVKAKRFKDKMVQFMKSTSKMSWNKDEMLHLIKSMWIDFLEDHIK